MRFINRYFNKKISSKGLGVFRILFSLVLFCEIIRLFRFRQLYFDPIPFIEPNLLSSELALSFWLTALFLLVIGLFTRLAAIINYIFVVLFISHMGSFEYHMDYTYIGVSFLLMFIPISRSFSIDRLRLKLNDNSIQTKPETTSVLSYWLIIFMGIGIIYFTSVYHKLHSTAWLNGLGLWLPASVTPITIADSQWLLNQEFLVKFLGYFTLIFELVFIFIFWVKPLRLVAFVIGVGLHIGILIEFPIPFFALGYVAIYTLLLPNCIWTKLEKKLTLFALTNRAWFQNIMNPFRNFNLPYRTIYTEDTHRILGIKLFLIGVISMQLITEIKNPFNKGILKTTYSNIDKASSKLFGISQHGVFLDSHFEGYDKIYNLMYNGELLPLFDENGMPDDYVIGGVWADFGFRVNRPYVSNHLVTLKNGLIRYSSFWAHKNDIDLSQANFKIIEKAVNGSFTWEKDLLKKNMEEPWKDAGTVIWDNYKATVILD